MKEYYYLYFWSETFEEWLLDGRYRVINDRVHYSLISAINNLKNRGIKFRIDFNEE